MIAFTTVHVCRLSSLGVQVLDSEEVERNVMDQARVLSERQGPEYDDCNGFLFRLIVVQELCTFSFPKTSLKNLNKLSMQYKGQLQKATFTTQSFSSIMDDASFLRLKQRIMLNEIEKQDNQKKQERRGGGMISHQGLLQMKSQKERKREQKGAEG